MSKFRDFRLKNKQPSNNSNAPLVNIGSNESDGSKAIGALLKQARKSGALNMANRNITEIPADVYRINQAQQIDNSAISFEKTDESWWDDVFLSKLILTANSITHISEDIELLDKLSYIDASDNKIAALPTSITKLRELKYLNISKNKISKLPEDIGQFEEVQQLLCGNNSIQSLPRSITSLANMTNLVRHICFHFISTLLFL